MKNLILTLLVLISLTTPCQAMSLSDNVDYQIEQMLACCPKISKPGYSMALLQDKLSLSSFSVDSKSLVCFDDKPVPKVYDKETGLVLHFIKVRIVQGNIQSHYFIYGSFTQNQDTGEVVDFKVIAINKETV